MGCRMSDLLEGVMLSEYLLLQCISRGGIADVYRARQTGEGNYEVAVKVFRPGYAQRESFREYFMTEAEKIAQFEHPNILPFLEFGEGEGLLYSVMPLVTTGTLGDLLRRVGGKFSAMQALQIMQQLCSAVQFAHEHDVIHGNIKPTNIFVAADSRMLLSDFGIVRGYDDSQQSLTRIGWGSAEYAAPEQSLGVLRRASDVYSLGVLLFRILTGEPPFTGQTPVEVLLKHVRQPAPSARSLDPNISDAVDGVLHMALQKRSDDRFASAEEFSNALAVAISVAPVASPVAKSITPITRQLTPDQTSTGDLSEDTNDSDITLARKTSLLQEHESAESHIYWSTEPVEWSPIGEETGNSMPATASEYLSSKSTPPETYTNRPSSPVKPTLDEETRSTEKAPDSRLKKLLPILVVILLLIGLIAALLSSFFLPRPPSSGNTGKEHLVGVIRSTAVNTNRQATNLSIGL
jgi:serine/threonine protein kinase